MEGAWAASRTDAWVVGEGSMAHWNGTDWTTSALPSGATGWLEDVHGLDASHVYAVTGSPTGSAPLDGNVLTWNGSSWSVEHTGDGTVTFSAVVPVATTEGYAIGNSGLSTGVGRIFAGPGTWTEEIAGSWTGILNAGVTDASGAVHVFGDAAVIFMRTSSGWVAEASGLEAGTAPPDLYAASRGGATVYVAGHGGAFLRRTF